jgi:hypothetical protein
VNIVKQGNGNRLCILTSEEKSVWDRIDAQGSTIFELHVGKFLTARAFQYKEDDKRQVMDDIDSMTLVDRRKTRDDIARRRRRS